MATGCRRIWFNFIGKGRARSFRFAPHLGRSDLDFLTPESGRLKSHVSCGDLFYSVSLL